MRYLTNLIFIFPLLLLQAEGAVVSVDYRSEKGVCFTATVNTETNTMRLTTWHVASGAQFLGMNLLGQDGVAGTGDDAAVEFVAWSGGTAVPFTTGSLNANFDIPENWDRSIGAGATGGDWFFVARNQTSDLPWNIPAGAEGEFLPGTRMSWSGQTNGAVWAPSGLYRVAISFSDEDGYIYLGQDDHCAGYESVGAVALVVPEPGAALMAALAATVVAARRRR